MKNQSGFSALSAILVIVIIAAAVGIGVYFFQQQRLEVAQKEIDLLEEKIEKQPTAKPTTTKPVETVTPDTSDTTVTPDSYTPKTTEPASTDTTTTKTSGSIYLGSFHTISEGQELFNQLATDQLEVNQETVQGEIMPISPKDNKTFYFSVLKTETDKLSTSRLYSYNPTAATLKEAYWERYGNIIHPMGITDNKLVVYAQKISADPIACFNPWLDAKIQALDLASPADGLNDYTPSEEILKQARLEKSTCQ